MERQAVAKFQKMPTGNAHLNRQSAPSSSSRNPLLELQRSIGNQAIQRLTSSPFIQAKLQISTPEDESEQEADRVADSVMRMPEPAVSRQAVVQPVSSRITPLAQRETDQPDEEEDTIVAPKSNSPVSVAVREDDEEEKPLVQRACDKCEEEKKEDQAESVDMVHRECGGQTATPKVTTSVAADIHAMNGGGSSLSNTTRAFFEPRFGADLSQVRVHTDSRATATASSIQAKAFTVGSNIAFGAGQYAPESGEGRKLLAHELTHVLQQNRSRVQPTIQRQPCPSTRDTDELTKSQSPAGLLTVDTSFDAAKESLSVQDFGIGQHDVPPTMTDSDNWRRMMSMIIGDPTTKVGVLGFSDCMGTENNNKGLRNRRADAVIRAMPAEAQAKVSPTFKGWFGPLTYLFPNNTAENRARNRMVMVGLMRSWTDSCDVLPKATNMDQYIFLVSCLEKRLGLTNAADAPKTLSLLRQLYFGNASWSTARNKSKIWDYIITDRPWAPGDDPTPRLGAKLLTALQDSKEVKFDSSASSTSIEISHMLTGLDAIRDQQNPAILVTQKLGGIYLQTNTLNHALATWAGDVGSAATNYTICVDFLKYSASYDDFFKDLASDADLEGDVDAYATWAALIHPTPNTPTLQVNLPISELLMQYYRLKKTVGGQARAQRFEVFANFYGANVQAKKMQNRLGFQQNIYASVKEIAFLLFVKQISEIVQGNVASVGNCAGGKPPAPGTTPVLDIFPLLASLDVASVEMTERFTVWLEQRL